MILQVAAGLYTLLIVGIIAFQVALVAGAPLGYLTQGGQYQGKLPPSRRVVAGASITLLLCMGAAIASTAGIVSSSLPTWTRDVTVIIQALTTVANWATPSTSERLLWAPVSTVMLVLAICVVALA